MLNTLATYGRSLLALGVGLFTTRWVLEALGQTDFGLYAVVGALLVFVTFINNISGSGIARFYAYSIGRGQGMCSEGAVDDLKRWFNTAFSVHLVFPLVVLIVGLPLGEYAVRHWIVVPAERMSACVWVWRIALMSSFVSMVTQPFIAMYAAHQLITELALFGVATTIISFCGSVWLLSASCDRLIAYALIMGISHAGLPLIQVARALCKFPSCRIVPGYFFDWTRIRSLFGFSGWYLFGAIGGMARNEGVAVLVNIYFGPKINASFGVANQVAAQTSNLSSALIGALSPAITTAEGAGRRSAMIDMAYRACKIGTLLVLLFCIPLALEMKEVLSLWLKDIPPHADIFCELMLLLLVMDKLTVGHMMAVNANGKIGVYQGVLGFVMLLTLPIAWTLISLFHIPMTLCWAFVITQCLYLIGRLYFGSCLVGMLPLDWLRRVFAPLLILMAVSVTVGLGVVLWLDQSFYRVCLTSAATTCSTVCLGWFVAFDVTERMFCKELWKTLWRKMRCS